MLKHKSPTKFNQRLPSERIVSVKEIAHELGVETRDLRALLRMRYGTHPNQPWQWKEKEANKLRQYLKRVLNGRGR
jgi:hypothetical protein